LFVNVDKCKTITFSKTRYPVEFAYIMNRTVLDRVSSVNDLGFIMDEKMIFLEHVDVMVGKDFAMLGFIRKLSLELEIQRQSEVSLQVFASSEAEVW
jgi:hypothetical protein